MPRENSPSDKDRAPSLKERALATIREALLSKRLKRDVMYTEASLTEELGISRTPVREALLHLASRGLITYFPRKGFKIKRLTEEDARNIFELRLVLELAVIRHITPSLAKEGHDEIKRIMEKYRNVAQRDDPRGLIHANMAFHACLAGLTQNTYLISALDEIGDLINLASARSLEFDSRTHEALEEHERIVAELKGRSLDGALREMEAHIRTTEERVLARIRSSQSRGAV